MQTDPAKGETENDEVLKKAIGAARRSVAPGGSLRS
jgi:hypothetical protein